MFHNGESAMKRVDAGVHFHGLRGQTIRTVTQGRANRIIDINGDAVVVATNKSPNGRAVPLEWVQDAFDRLSAGEEVPISVRSLGYRSAFVGAAMLSLRGTELLRGPTRVRLRGEPK